MNARTFAELARAEVVRDLREVLVRAGIGHGGRDVTGDQLEEAPVVVVERSAWADPQHQHTRGPLEPGAYDR